MSQEWELINKSADMYLDNLNGIYEVQKLNNKYADAIDSTSSLSAQRKLKEVQEQEMKILKDKDKLTQYDIDRANLKYELTLKQIALEEAQQNKSTLRLRRDSQGNYTYQYAADEDEIDKAKDELADLYNQLYNLDKDKYQENLDEMLEMWKDFQDEAKDIAKRTDLTDDEKRKQIQLLADKYVPMMEGLAKQNEEIQANLTQSALAESINLLGQDFENFEMFSSQQQKEINDFLQKYAGENGMSFNELLEETQVNAQRLGQAAFGVATQTGNDIVSAFSKMNQNIIENAHQQLIPGWTSAIQSMVDNIKGEQGTRNFEQMITNMVSNVNQRMLEMRSSIDSVSAQAVTSFENLKNNGLDPVVETTNTLIDKTKDVVDQYLKKAATLNEVTIPALKDLEEQLQKTIEQEESLYNTALNAANALNDQTAATWNLFYAQSALLQLQSQEAGANADAIAQNVVNQRGSQGTVGFASGGYTGTWADGSRDGKLAWLHQKELVLNAEDTKNFLTGIELMKEMLNDLQQQAILNVNLNAPVAPDILTGPIVNDNSQQNVYVEANFPNVESADEIKSALNNLTITASQRVNRKENY